MLRWMQRLSLNDAVLVQANCHCTLNLMAIFRKVCLCYNISASLNDIMISHYIVIFRQVELLEAQTLQVFNRIEVDSTSKSMLSMTIITV